MVAPISLEATPVAGGVAVRVIGKSTSAIDATFALELAAGSNRSVHRGQATLAGGKAAVFSTLTVSTSPNVGWKATLQVNPSIGEPYEQVASSG